MYHVEISGRRCVTDASEAQMEAIVESIRQQGGDQKFVYAYRTFVPIADLMKDFGIGDDAKQSLMARQAEKRPPNYAELSARDQWDADKKLGILDWDGK